MNGLNLYCVLCSVLVALVCCTKAKDEQQRPPVPAPATPEVPPMASWRNSADRLLGCFQDYRKTSGYTSKVQVSKADGEEWLVAAEGSAVARTGGEVEPGTAQARVGLYDGSLVLQIWAKSGGSLASLTLTPDKITVGWSAEKGYVSAWIAPADLEDGVAFFEKVQATIERSHGKRLRDAAALEEVQCTAREGCEVLPAPEQTKARARAEAERARGDTLAFAKKHSERFRAAVKQLYPLSDPNCAYGARVKD